MEIQLTDMTMHALTLLANSSLNSKYLSITGPSNLVVYSNVVMGLYPILLSLNAVEFSKLIKRLMIVITLLFKYTPVQ